MREYCTSTSIRSVCRAVSAATRLMSYREGLSNQTSTDIGDKVNIISVKLHLPNVSSLIL